MYGMVVSKNINQFKAEQFSPCVLFSISGQLYLYSHGYNPEAHSAPGLK